VLVVQRRCGYYRFPILLALLGSFVCADSLDAMDIIASGSWSIAIGVSDLLGGAGTNLTNSFESASGQVQLTIFNTAGLSDNWRVDVRRTDVNWPAGLVLLVRRTDDGTGSGSIIDGNSYQAVVTTDTPLFSGSGDRSTVGVQILLSGISVQVNPHLYAESLIYTVVDTL